MKEYATTLLWRHLGALTLILSVLLAAPSSSWAQSTLVSRIEKLEPQLPRARNPDSLFLVAKRHYAQALGQKDVPAAAAGLQEMGRICYRLGQYPQAFDYFRQVAGLLGAPGHFNQLADNYSDLGTLYYSNRQPQQARQQFERALGLYQRAGNLNGTAATYGKIGHLFEKQRRYDSAAYYQRLALRQYGQLHNQRGMAKIYENLGSIFEDFARYDSAQVYFQQALQLSQRSGDEVGQIEILNNLGDALRKTGQYAHGMRLTRQALVLAYKTGEHHQLSEAYNDIAKTHSLLGRHDSAYYYLALSRKYQSAIYSADNNQQLALLQTLYSIEHKDQEIAQLNTTRYVNRIMMVAGTGVGVLVLLLSGLVISRQRLKLRSEQALSEQNQRVFEAQRELMELELRNKALEEQNLKQELAVRSRELTTNTLHVIQKNQLLEELRGQLGELVKDDKRDQKKQLKQLLHQIGQGFHHDQHWEDFRLTFEQVHQPFLDNLQRHCSSLTAGERRLAALLKMNLTSQDIATSLGVSLDSLRVMRYRLRKRLSLASGSSLTAFLQGL